MNRNWIDVCAVDDVPLRGARTVKTATQEIAVFRTAEGEVFALENRCPHRGGPLSEGIVHGKKVACPLHNWVIDLTSGAATGADEGCAEHIPVKIEAGRICLSVAIAAAA